METVYYFTFIILLLLLSAVFSGSETALFSLNKVQLKRLHKRSPARARIINEFLDSPRRTLNTILTGNMLVNITLSALVSALSIRLWGQDKGVLIAIISTALMLLIFGEVTPKIFAIRNAEKFSQAVSCYLRWFSRVIFPLRQLWSGIADFLFRLSVKSARKKQPFITEGELKALVSIGEKEGIIEANEKEMIHTVFEFGDRFITEIMTPRVDIVSVDVESSSQELTEILKKSRHSKVPVYKDTIDNILGVIYSKEYLLKPADNWQSLVSPITFVPKVMTIDDLLSEFHSQKSHIAVVTDEYGGTAGIVTIEDVLEEIVGEIHDEYDTEEKLVIPVDKFTISVSGKTTLHDLKEDSGINLKAEEAETVGGFVTELFGRLPKSGDIIRHKKFIFIVDDVIKNRVRKITIKRLSKR